MVFQRIVRIFINFITEASEKLNIRFHCFYWLDPCDIEDRSQKYQYYRDDNLNHLKYFINY